MRHGFIRDPEDIKFLIMYSMSFMPFAIPESDILDIVMVDDAFGYFEFSEAFRGLLDTRHVGMVDTGGDKEYILTPKGQQMIADMYTQLPSTVRDKAEKAAIGAVTKIRRQGAIKASHRENTDGTYTVSLGISERDSQHLGLEILVMTRRQCALIEENFKENAEEIFSTIIHLLSGSGKTDGGNP